MKLSKLIGKTFTATKTKHGITEKLRTLKINELTPFGDYVQLSETPAHNEIVELAKIPALLEGGVTRTSYEITFHYEIN